MRLQLVTGYWLYDSFSCLGKIHQFLETWRCDGSASGHLALRFIPDNSYDTSVFNRMEVFGEKIFYKSGCESILFDITRSREPTFHMVKDAPWTHESTTHVMVYDVTISDDIVQNALQICTEFASGIRPYVYDNCAYINAFFPVCFQCCPMSLGDGHCTQFVLQILSEAIYGDVNRLRYELRYDGMCTGRCTWHPPYASYSPRKAIVALHGVNLVNNGKPLHGEQCHKFAFHGTTLRTDIDNYRPAERN